MLEISNKQLVYLCNKYNKNYNNVHRRLYRGWTLEEALELVIDNYGEITLHGRKFDSLRDAAKAYRLGILYIIKGLRKNKTILEIFRIRNNDALIVNGKKIDFIEDAIKDIPDKIYMQRIRRGWYIEEVISGKKETSSRGRYFRGKYFKNLKAISDHYNINYVNFVTRLNRGWTLEEAVNGKRVKKKKGGK